MAAPTFFATPAEFRAWLEEHHATERELLVGFHKVGSGRASMTWPQSVDEALCYGWIDGVRKSIDKESYTIRFTPRKRGSIWSLRNVERVAVLEAEGRMRAAGRAAFAAREPQKTGVYSFEKPEATLTAEETARLRADAAAWADWQARPPGYRKLVTHWIVEAKRPETRAKRLAELLDASARGEKIQRLTRPGERGSRGTRRPPPETPPPEE